jgi:hypothetical protein
MRDLTANLLSEQAKLNRKPETKLVFRDVMLRLDQDWQTGISNSGYPDLKDSDDMPQCPIDMHVREYRPTPGDPLEYQMMRGWSSATRAYMRVMSDLSSWTGNTYQYVTDAMHRVTLLTQYIYYAYYDELGGTKNIRYASGASNNVYQTDAYTCDTDHLALAAVPDGYATSGAGLYMVVLHEEGTYKHLSLHYLDGDSTIDCPHDIVVDQDYNVSSLQWFDAASLGDDDVIIVNTRAHGQPMVITRSSNGVWSTPRYIMRIDQLDSNSFLRISHLESIEDSTGDEVLWATGRLSRPGSTGAHPQAFDIALRSKDGEHWTFDRHSYVCSSEMRSKLLPIGDYVYYLGSSTVMRGKRTWLMNNDHADLKLEVTDDILSWSLTQPKEGAAMSGSATLAAGDAIYNQDTEDSDYLGRWTTSDGALAISPGMWLWRYAGYNGYQEAISVEGIDATPGSYQVAQRAFSIRSRDIVMRSLYDWSADQTYELLSQVMHRDPCTKLNKLYSISAGQIEVEQDEDEEITGNVDEDELSEDDTSGQLIFDTPNKPAINLCTKPTEARDFEIKARFKLSDDSNESGIASGYVPSTMELLSSSTGSYSGAAQFQDPSSDLSPYWTHETEAHYIIVVENTDGTIAWGYIGDGASLSTDYLRVKQDKTMNDIGWNGTTGTASTYRIARADSWARLGTGVGVCGCVTDQYNLIAAVPDLKDEKLYLLIRRGDEDSNVWIPWKTEGMSSSPIKSNEMYEVVMIRRGSMVEAQMFRFPYNGGSYGSRESVTSKISAEWPLNEPMVDVSDESYDQTDRGKVGVICAIATPETELGQCRSDRDWLPRNPDLFVRGTEDSGEIVYEDIYTDWEDFSMGYDWDGSAWVANADSIPPFHFGGEKYDQQDPNVGISDYFGDQWNYWDSDDYDPSTDRWERVKVGATNKAAYYPRSESNGMSEQNRTIPVRPDGNNLSEVWGDAYGAKIVPMVIIGEPHDASDHEFQAAMSSYSELVANRTVVNTSDFLHVLDIDPDDWARLDEWHWIGAPDRSSRFPYFKIYPGFYLPGRAHPNEPKTAHAKGAKIRQHWSPKLYIEGVWATDGESDKSLEWTMKDIATRAGVLDFDTEYSINQSIPASNGAWLSDVHGDDVYQRDFDLTFSLSDTLPSGEYMQISVRAQSRETMSPNDDTYILLLYGNDTSNGPYISAYQANGENATLILVDRHYLDSSHLGTEIRVVARERFFTFYIDGYQCPSLTVGPTYGVDQDGWDDGLDTAGYVSISSSASVSVTVTQPELWAWTDAVVVDTRQNAIGGLEKALRDRRIKFVPTIGSSDEPVLRIGYMALPYITSNITTFDHWLGTITDHESGDADYPSGGTHVSIYRDETGETDRIPSHVRVVGSEVSEYVDHDSARRYGLLFMSHQCPYLEEEEAYQEAARIVRDAISHSGSRRPTTAAQLHWESEDALLLDYTTYDGKDVSGHFIVDSVTLNYTIEPSLEASAGLRKLSWGS